jgi:hypothetical protein
LIILFGMLRQAFVPATRYERTTLMLRTAILALLVCGSALAGPRGDPSSWENLKRLAPGQSIQVARQNGETLVGKLAGVSEDSITVARKSQTIAVPRSAVSWVRVSRKRRTHTLIGAAIGAAAGVGLGAAGGESLNQSSGGDFANLKPAITAGCGVAGALIGAVVGSLVGNRGTIIYRAK